MNFISDKLGLSSWSECDRRPRQQHGSPKTCYGRRPTEEAAAPSSWLAGWLAGLRNPVFDLKTGFLCAFAFCFLFLLFISFTNRADISRYMRVYEEFAVRRAKNRFDNGRKQHGVVFAMVPLKIICLNLFLNVTTDLVLVLHVLLSILMQIFHSFIVLWIH